MNFIFKQIYSIQCRVLSHKNMTKYWKIPQSFWKTNCITNKEESFNNILRKYRLNLINPGQNNGIQHLMFDPWTLSTTLNTSLRGSLDHTHLVTMDVTFLNTNIPYDEISSPARRCWIEERFRVYTHPLHHCSTNDSDKLEKIQLCAGLLILV